MDRWSNINWRKRTEANSTSPDEYTTAHSLQVFRSLQEVDGFADNNPVWWLSCQPEYRQDLHCGITFLSPITANKVQQRCQGLAAVLLLFPAWEHSLINSKALAIYMSRWLSLCAQLVKWKTKQFKTELRRGHRKHISGKYSSTCTRVLFEMIRCCLNIYLLKGWPSFKIWQGEACRPNRRQSTVAY